MDLAPRRREDRRPPGGPRALRLRHGALGVAALLVFGVVLRAGLQFPLHRFAPDGDCAVMAFGAWDVLAGGLPAFIATGFRQGALACYLTATASFFVGPGRAALGLEIFAVGILQMFVWWRALLVLTGWSSGAAASARLLAFIVLPAPAVVYWVLCWPNGYPETFLAATLVLWAGARFWRRGGTANLFAFGLAAGFAFWMSMQSLTITIPLFVWLLWQRGAELLRLRQTALLAAGAVLGAMPWLVFNALHGWVSLKSNWAVRPARGVDAWIDHSGRLFGEVLQQLFAAVEQRGHVVPASSGQRALGFAALALVLAAVVALATALRQDRRVRLAGAGGKGGSGVSGGSRASEPAAAPGRLRAIVWLAAGIVALSSVLFIFSAAASMPGNIVRYVLPVYLLWPLVVALAWESAGRPLRHVLSGLALVVLAGYASAVPWPWSAERAEQRLALTVQRAIVERLAASGVEAVFGPFWEVYPVLFESGGKLGGSTLEPELDFHHLADRLPAGPCRWAFVGRTGGVRRITDSVGIPGQVERFADGRRIFLPDPQASRGAIAPACSEVLAGLRKAFRKQSR